MKALIIEYEVRVLDPYGDAHQVEYAATARAAVALARRHLADGAAAVVVERHTSRRPAHRYESPDVYEVIYADGLTSALREWGLPETT